jgi:hypothetical protein
MVDDSDSAVKGEPGVARGTEFPVANLGDPADPLVSAAEAVARRAESFIDQAESVTAALTDLAAVRDSGRQGRRPPEQSSVPYLERDEVEPPAIAPVPGAESHRAPLVGEPQARRGALVPTIEAGYNKVGVIRLGRLHRSKAWPGTLRAAGAVTLPAMWPLLLNVMLLAVARDHALVTLHANLWVVALGLVNAAGIMTAWRGWWNLHRAAPDLEKVLIGSQGQASLAAWFQRTLGHWRQLSVSVAAVPLGCLLLAMSQPAIEDQLEIGLVSYITVGWTGLLASNGGYWVVVVAALSRRILRLKDLRLVWHSPASTPGIAGLSSGYTFGTAAGLAILFGLELLALQVSTYGDSQVLRAMSITFVVAAALLALVFGILPHWWLYQTVRDARRRVLKQLTPPTDTPPETPAEIAAATSRVQLYRLVESSPGLPFSTKSMVEYGATVLATLTATLLIILLGGG